MPNSQALEILVPNGNPNDLVIADLANWKAKAFKIAYNALSECHRKDANDAGVYLLFNEALSHNHKTVYIGESMHILTRLHEHFSACEKGQENFCWTDAVFFTSPDLNKSQIRYLEKILVEKANFSNTYRVATRAVCKNTTLTEAQSAAMDTFIQNIDITLRTFGFHPFERQEIDIETTQPNPEQLLANFGRLAAIPALTGEMPPHKMLEDLTEKINEAIKYKDSDYLLSTSAEFQLLESQLNYIEEYQTLALGHEASIRANVISNLLKNIAMTNNWDAIETLQPDMLSLNDAVRRLETCNINIQGMSKDIQAVFN